VERRTGQLVAKIETPLASRATTRTESGLRYTRGKGIARSSADALRESHKPHRGRWDLLVSPGPARALIGDLLAGPGA